MTTLISRIAKIQEELKAPKNQYNSFGKYKYRSAEDILEAVKPLLNGLVQTIKDDIILVGDRYYLKATVTVTDGKDSIETSALAREADSKKGMDSAQVTGATSSYARKYALNGMWNIDDSKDADTMGPPKETRVVQKKETLVRNSDKWKSAVAYVKSGKPITDIEAKYTISDEDKKELEKSKPAANVAA